VLRWPLTGRGPLALIGASAALAPLCAETIFRGSYPDVGYAETALYAGALVLFAVACPGLRHPAPAAAPATSVQALFLALAIGLASVGVILAWQAPRASYLVVPWVGGLACLIVAVRLRPAPQPGTILLSAAALALLAAVLRLIDLGTRPVIIDELAMMPFALELGREITSGQYLTARGISLFAADRGLFSQLALTTYLSTIAFAVGGIDLAWLRVPSALIGTAEIVAVFFTGRAIANARVAGIAALTLAGLAAHLEFSRNGQRLIEASLAWCILTYLLVRGTERRDPRYFLGAGAVLSLTLFVYWAYRPAVTFVAATIVLLVVLPETRGLWIVRAAGMLVAGFLVGAGPMLAPYLRDPSLYLFRSEKTSWLGAAIQAYRATGEIGALQPILRHVEGALLGFNVLGSVDNHYLPDRGLLLLVPAAFLAAGAAFALRHVLAWRLGIVSLWFWGSATSLMMLSDATPITHRGLPVLPAAAVLVGIGADRLIGAFERVGILFARGTTAVVFAGLVASAVLDIAFYFFDYARRDFDTAQDTLVRYVLERSAGSTLAVFPGISAYGMELDVQGKPFQWASDLEERVQGMPLGRLAEQIPLLERRGDVSIMLPEAGAAWVDEVAAAYPGSRIGVLRSRFNPDAVGWTVILPDNAVRIERPSVRLHGANGAIHVVAAGASVVRGAEIPTELTFPVGVEWRGWARLATDSAERIVLRYRGPAPLEIALGAQRSTVDPGSGSTVLRSARGPQPLWARTVLPHPGADTAISIERGGSGDGDDPGSVPISAWPGPPRVRVEWAEDASRAVVLDEFDVHIADHRFNLRRPAPGMYRVAWRATLHIAVAGPYEFEIVSDGPTRLAIGGRQIWPRGAERLETPGGPLESRRARVTLTAEDHDLRVERLLDSGGKIHLQWRRGTEPFRLVPAHALRPIVWP